MIANIAHILGQCAAGADAVQLGGAASDFREPRQLNALFRDLRRRGVRRVIIEVESDDQANSVDVASLVLASRVASRHGVDVRVRCEGALRAWIRICRLDSLIES
ncbi:MAG: hypothetical protein VYC34_08000 [Planctomycetota bacterium]|nr:hypothetical protein [Planctomycetota bacterium]